LYKTGNELLTIDNRNEIVSKNVNSREDWGFMKKHYVRLGLFVNVFFLILFTAEAITLEKNKDRYTNQIQNKIETRIRRRELRKTASEPRTIVEKTLVKEKEYELNEAEYNLLLRLVEAEAGGEDKEGKILVANVVFNRVKNEKFPDSVSGVILQQDENGAQFSPVSDGRLQTVNVSTETKEAVEEALYVIDLSDGALYFVARTSANPNNVRWFDECLTPVLRHGGHEFFR